MTLVRRTLTSRAARTSSFSSCVLSTKLAIKSASRPASLSSFLMISISSRLVRTGERTGPSRVRGSKEEILRIVTSSRERVFRRANRSCVCLSVALSGTTVNYR
ncbi:hypothetical protein FVEG_15840 [Fusarium verticillioides 7600]|uniref:Uncharacterized protein n=1 Tax=Gibberella moniliformis (strain M3125 / FGSC 7600) TaxID=334819 RepID=W7MDD8_GIBM7|nr:hypothetical protein FVEG_15840 [Fusarium verticillioides 7600]EWG45599.1 hypothetical protein FVEG_15840 [Fusarium verticillioides 7600]